MCDVGATGGGRFIDCGSAGMMQRLLTSAAPDGVSVSGAFTDTPQSVPVVKKKVNLEPDASTLPTPPVSGTMIPTIAIVGHGCLLPGGASSPPQLLSAIQQQRVGIVDQSKIDPYWMEDFYSKELVSDRSTSPLSGLVNDEDIVVPEGIDSAVF